MKLPKTFDLKINLKRAIGNAAAVVALMTVMGIHDKTALIAGAVFGLVGGSVNDIVGWMGNRQAIEHFSNSTSKDEEQ